MKISIPELVVPADSLSRNPDDDLYERIAGYCGIKESDILSYHLEKRSLDARKKPHVKILYRLTAELKDSARPCTDVVRNPLPEPVPDWQQPVCRKGKELLKNPLIVGAGPAGLFAALTLARAGCEPVVLERGFDVDRRKQHIDSFFQTRILNENSNLLFGEGGAGTWSDGKLFTRIRDPRMKFVMNSFVNAGANPNILYYSHPHVGSDKLPGIIAALRQQIIEAGGSFLWGTEVKKVLIRNQKCCGVVLKDDTIMEAPAVLLACGHSARPLILNLLEQHVACQKKGFQIGCRMEHPQEFINTMQYGRPETLPALGAAEYSLVSKGNPERSLKGAVSFCMCPGGEIIPATCDINGLCTNGMSNAARDGKYANAALITTIEADEFASPQDAFSFLYQLEQKAFQSGGSDYTVPDRCGKQAVQPLWRHSQQIRSSI